MISYNHLANVYCSKTTIRYSINTLPLCTFTEVERERKRITTLYIYNICVLVCTRLSKTVLVYIVYNVL